MAIHHGPDGPELELAAAVEDAAAALLSRWDLPREEAATQLSSTQLRALFAVEAAPGMNLGALAGRLSMLLSSASRLCDRLVAAGLLERGPGRDDRREIALTLTPAAADLLVQLRDERHRQIARVLAGMSPTGRAALLRGLREFAAVARGDQQPAVRTA
ncbi:MAG TPA: MarR family transcriptional regulator [Pilimelia sp.]|nr:MarR family transcriptional regulator [Pilimelia sp.]